MTAILNLNVHNLISIIQGHALDNKKTIIRERYLNAPQYICPILESINPQPISNVSLNESKDPRFQNLVNALMNNQEPLILDFVELPNEKNNPEALIKKYPVKATGFIFCPADKFKEPSSVISRILPPKKEMVVNFVSLSEFSEIQSLTLKVNLENRESSLINYTILLECDHWTTAVKIKLLMFNLFKLNKKFNGNCGKRLFLIPEDEEQFLDMIEFIAKPINLNPESIPLKEYK